MATLFRFQGFTHSLLLGIEQAATTQCMFTALAAGPADPSTSYILRNLISQGTTAFLLDQDRKVKTNKSFLKVQVVYQTALALDLSLLSFPDHFVPIAAASTTLKGLAWTWFAMLDFNRVSDLKAEDSDLFVRMSVAHMLGNGVGVGLGILAKPFIGPGWVFLAVAPVRYWIGKQMYG